MLLADRRRCPRHCRCRGHRGSRTPPGSQPDRPHMCQTGSIAGGFRRGPGGIWPTTGVNKGDLSTSIVASSLRAAWRHRETPRKGPPGGVDPRSMHIPPARLRWPMQQKRHLGTADALSAISRSARMRTSINFNSFVRWGGRMRSEEWGSAVGSINFNLPPSFD